MGNHVTLTNPWDYKSSVTKITIPSGVSPTTYNKFTNSYSGGFLTSIDWNPPNANWYLGASTIFRNLNADPVFCYLAVIEEPYKINNGFKLWYDPLSNTNITAFALQNNNVATVNSYLASPNNSYKRRLANGNFASNIGVILVDNPNDLEVINLSLLGDRNINNFLNNGNIFLTFDEVLWNSWSLVNFAGTGFEFAGSNRVRITNLDSASFSGILLNEGQRGMIGLGFEYFSENLPDSDYCVSFALGAYESFPSNQIGSPTNFSSSVYNIPQFEEDDLIQDLTSLTKLKSNGLNQISVFPNPVSDKIVVSFAAIIEIETVEVNILNADGRKVYSNKYDCVRKNNNTINIETNRLSSGLYLIELKTIHGVQYHKFIKND